MRSLRAATAEMTLADKASGKAKDHKSSRSERRKARTANAITDAGERLFISRGYSATTIENLAEEADVAVGSIYAHFGSKEGVYSALIERALELAKQYCDEGFNAGARSLVLALTARALTPTAAVGEALRANRRARRPVAGGRVPAIAAHLPGSSAAFAETSSAGDRRADRVGPRRPSGRRESLQSRPAPPRRRALHFELKREKLDATARQRR